MIILHHLMLIRDRTDHLHSVSNPVFLERFFLRLRKLFVC